MSEYVGIKAGALHEHTELSEYYCARCGHPVTDHDSYCRECGGAFQRSFATEPCDRDALLALADEFDGKADYIASCIESMDGDFDMHAVEAEAEQREYARRIRKACGAAE